MKICDRHGLRFEEGNEKIIQFLNACLLSGEGAIQIIHGYHGHAFKDYIQSQDFIDEMAIEGIYLKQTARHSKDGVTEFQIEAPEKSTTDSNPTLFPESNPFHNEILTQKKKMNLEEAKVYFTNFEN